MKKIGLIGGMSWESTLTYYQIMNRKIREKLGGYHSCKLILESVDFAQIEHLQHHQNWEALNTLMIQSAMNLERAGAELIVLCTNTMHLCTPSIISQLKVSFLHIVDVTGEQIKKRGLQQVVLLGTKFTMESGLYPSILKDQYRIDCKVPTEKDRQTIHNIIYSELVHGIIRDESRSQLQGIINKSIKEGAQGVILGCTEIGLILKEKDVEIPYFDTTSIHAEAAVDRALI